MSRASIKLEKIIPPDKLEEILIGAAQEVGWKAVVADHFSKIYRLGSVHEEKRYSWTNLNLWGTFLPMAQITFDKRTSTAEVDLYSGFGTGFATEKELRKYLIALSQRVADYQPQTPS